MFKYLNKTLKNVAVISLFLIGTLQLNGETLAIDKGHSEVGFSIKHLMISNVKGKFTDYDADLEYDLKSKQFTKFDAYVSATSIDTGIEKRDNHLRSPDFFEVAKFPKLTFKMSKYEDGALHGDLTIHGITKQVSFVLENNGTIKDLQGNTRVGFTLEAKINRKDFGLTWNKALELGGVMVGDTVKITIELETVVL
jgi:polyisoprenoid-binding protein YceI